MDKKLVVVIMGQNCDKFIGMCVDSVKDADDIIYCDGGSEEGFYEKYFLAFMKKTKKEVVCIENKWNPKDVEMNGKQRNFYLKYLKENHPNDWCLVLDADELVEDLSKIKELIQTAPLGLYSVKMRHFIGDLGHEDNTHETHFVPNRLFKISKAKEYPLHSHPILISENNDNWHQTTCTTIWHLGHLPVEYMDYILKRYKQHSTDSQIHTQEFLEEWKMSHLFGKYPIREINPIDLPKQICDRYEIDMGKIYHSRYNVELKHPLMVQQWYDYFKPKSVLDLGCGRGCYLYFWRWFVEEYCGIEISDWAVKHAFCNNIVQGDVSKPNEYDAIDDDYDLITAIDILEHLDDEQLNNTLDNMKNYGKKFLFSIPFEGDPNLKADNTHKQFHDRDWWIKKIESYGIKVSSPPHTWLYAHQILIGEKNG